MRGFGADQAQLGQRGVGVADGVEVHAPLAGRVAQGREDGAGLEGAGGDAVAEAFGELVVERERARGVELELHGMLYNTRTISEQAGPAGPRQRPITGSP